MEPVIVLPDIRCSNNERYHAAGLKRMIYLNGGRKIGGLIGCLCMSFLCHAQWQKQPVNPVTTVIKEYRIVINKDTLNKYPVLPGYPAVAVSLTNNGFVMGNTDRLPGDARREDEIIKMNADLWIEPRDPEIAILPENSGKLKAVTGNPESYNSQNINNIALTEDNLKSGDIKPGTVFWLKKQSGLVFKIRIDSYSKEQEELSLTYQLLE